MTDTIEKQKLLDWLNQYADALLARGPMYGSFAEQEAIIRTLRSMRDFVSGKSPESFGDSARYNICRKYKLNSVLSFAYQVPGNPSSSSPEQAHFSQILRDWWEYKHSK